jgi:ribonuclease HI
MLQGPCKSNQLIICNSKFLEYAVQILNEDEKIFAIKKLIVHKESSKNKMIDVLLGHEMQDKYKKAKAV